MIPRVLVWLSVWGMATAAPQDTTALMYPGYPGNPGYPGYPGYPGCNNAGCNYSPLDCCCCWGARPPPPTPVICPEYPACPTTTPKPCPPVITCPPITTQRPCPIITCPPPRTCPPIILPPPCPVPETCPPVLPCPWTPPPPPCPWTPPPLPCPVVTCPTCPPVIRPTTCPPRRPCPRPPYCPTPRPPICPPVTPSTSCPITPVIPPVTPRPCPGPYCPPMPCTGQLCPPFPCVRPPTMTCPPVKRNKRSLRQQRRCELPGHCPVGYSCCSGGCSGGKVCMRDPDRQVKMSIIFSSTSHLSHLLISREVLPAIQSLPKSLKLELIPTSLDYQSRGCQADDPECLGNLIVSCAGRHLHDLTATLEFSLCFIAEMTYMNGNNLTHIAEATRLCMAPHPAEQWQKVYECGSSDEGKQLFLGAQYREQQLAIPDMQLPSVALDDEVVISQPSDLPTLRQRLCQLLYNAPEAKVFCQTLTYR